MTPRSVLRLTLAATCVLVADASAQTSPCDVGTKVAFEWSPDTVGTVALLGTEPPYVGWFGIKFAWSERIQWSAPDAKGLLVAGTKTRCVGKLARAEAPAPAPKAPTPQAAAAPPGDTACPLTEPPGKVKRSSAPSAELFKRVIYEKAAVRADPGSTTAPSKVGISFPKFEVGEPIRNTWTSSRFGDKRVHTGAPLDAVLHPVKTREVLCELYGDKVRRTITEENRTCFQNGDGDWVCPAGGGGRFVENVLLPAR